MKTLALPLACLIALAACDGGTSDTEPTNAPETASAPAPEVSDVANAEPSPLPSTIPAAIQGRWGMVPADCEPGRDDAKGLLTISPTTLEFYESVGTLAEVEEASGTRIRASFAFTGEGMTWQRDEILDVQDGGQTLIRREYGEDAAPGPFRYSKCG
jgi:hypothetical protein